jgi:hypothetical protein
MKFRIVETTGDPDHVPCRWQADCGRFKYAVWRFSFEADSERKAGTVSLTEAFAAGLLGAGSDWVEVDSLSVHDSFDKAEAACKAHLAGIVAELQKELT